MERTNGVGRTRRWLLAAIMLLLVGVLSAGSAMAADAVFIVGKTNLDSGDAAVNTALSGLGFTVTLVDDGQCSSSDANGMDVVVISASCKGSSVTNKFRAVTVPVVVWEKDVYDDMDLTTSQGTDSRETQVDIVDSSHAMAAGLSGTVTVYSGNETLSYGVPTGNADIVATVEGNSSRPVLWGYEIGAVMANSFTAPARRVGVFMDADSADTWTTNGQDLFEAAVTWATTTPANQAPTADAGPDQNVTDTDDGGDEDVTLDGSGSSDSDGTIASYVWEENSSQIATGVGPVVTLSVAVHTIDLTVTDDDTATDSDSVVITVNAYVNVPPTADAGPDQNVIDTDQGGDEDVTLDGSGSSDSDGTIASYVWEENSSQIATGVGPVVTLSVAAHTIDLTVTDDDAATDSDSVVVTVSAGANIPPTADAGAHQSVLDTDENGSEDVTLDGSGSSDSDGTITSYVWEEDSSQIATGVSPTVSLDVNVHTIYLTVTDDAAATDIDSVIATVVDPNQLRTLGTPSGPRFTVTDKIWPANAGDADVCLWADDAHGAVSITIDVTGGFLDWWQQVGIDYGIGVTWFVITWQMDNEPEQYASWAELAALQALGHDIQSHSITHLNETRGFDEDDPFHDQNVEYRDSKAAIETNLGIPCLTIAYPGGSGFDNYPDLAMNYYIAGRGTTSQVNRVAEIDYPNIRSIGDGLEIDEPTSTWKNLSNLFDNSHYGYRGWYVTHYHGLDAAQQAKITAGLDYLQTKDAEVGIWNCLYRHGAQYAQERDSAMLTTDSVTASEITLTLTDTMMDSLFDYPLTIKVRLPSGWAGCTATQGGSGVASTVIQYLGDDYALVQAVPDQGQIVLTDSGGGNIAPTADAGPDQNVTDTDEGGDEDVTLDGSGSSDSDGTIVSYEWEEATVSIASGVSPQVTLSVAVHTIDLIVTDDDTDTDTDSVVITVSAPAANIPPTADAGPDQNVTDTDDGGDEDVTLDGSGSSDSDGTIASYDWEEASVPIGTGVGPTVTLSVAVHTIDLTVTDDDTATDSDSVVVTVNAGGGGDTYIVGCDTADQVVHEDGTFRSVSQKDARVGFDQSSLEGSYVMVFQLPTLGVGETVTDANLDVYLELITSGMVGNVDLYGLPYRASSAVVAGDFYHGSYDGDAGATALQDDICVLTTSVGWIESDGTGDNNLATYLQAQYTAGATGGDYVFIRLSSDYIGVPDYKYYRFTTANDDASTDWPVLTIITGAPPANEDPIADAGPDQNVTDTDEGGDEDVTLDGSGSTDSDGTIVSYDWEEASVPVATGVGPTVTLTVAVHTIDLTVTDDDTATDTDSVIITVNAGGGNVPPTANAGPDQNVTDTDDGGDEDVTLDGSGSTDSDGTISSYLWEENSSQIATGVSPVVTLTVAVHAIDLTVTDNESATDIDSVGITVNPAPASGAYYVDQSHPSASDSNNGSESSPWLTVDHAVDNVTAGDTIYVKEGIYREDVTLSVSGTSGNVITLQAYPGDRAVISGASELTGWTQCTSQIAGGNPDYADIYYVDISWKPVTLYQDGVELPMCQMPDRGWYGSEGGSGTTCVDTTNLTQADDYWNGATFYHWRINEYQWYVSDVTDFDSSSGTLTLANQNYAPDSNDRYMLQGVITTLNEAGEWGFEDQGGGTYRIFVWASGDGDPDNYLMEAPDPSIAAMELVDTGSVSYWLVDGLEIRHGTGDGFGSDANATRGYYTVQNCSIHHNEGNGIDERYVTDATYRRNYVSYNSPASGANGIRLVTPTYNVLIEENEIGFNTKDGIKLAGYNHIVRRNYIHDHWYFGHGDNIQTNGASSDVLIQDNLIWHSDQIYQCSQMGTLTLDGNIMGGSVANLMNFGVTDLTCVNNVFTCAGSQVMNAGAEAGETFDFTDNIWFNGHNTASFLMESVATFTADYNLYYFADGIAEMDGTLVKWDGNQNMPGLAAYQTASGEDDNALFGSPVFTNAPLYWCKVDHDRHLEHTTTRVYIGSQVDNFAVDDHIELDADGIVLTVTAVGADYVDFSPASERHLFKCETIANWGTATDYTLDFSLDTGSAAIGAGTGGADIGASIDTVQFQMGDFTGDDVRDIPDWIENPN